MDFSTIENQIKRLKFPSFEPVFLLAAFSLPLPSCPPAAASSGQECVLFMYPPCRHTLPCCVMGGWSSWTMDGDIPLGMEGDKLQHSWMSGRQNLLSTTRPWGNIHLFRAVRISLKIFGLVFALPQDGKKPVQILCGGFLRQLGLPVSTSHCLVAMWPLSGSVRCFDRQLQSEVRIFDRMHRRPAPSLLAQKWPQ